MRTQLVSRLLAAAPGIDTLTSLNAIDPFDLPAAARIDYLSALERQISWLQAMMQRAIVAVAGEEGSKSDDVKRRRDCQTADEGSHPCKGAALLYVPRCEEGCQSPRVTKLYAYTAIKIYI